MDTKLYPGIAFSPQAALADNIGAADTIIRVTDVSAFPDAPNLATIGTDEEGETILYAAKTAEALSGCARGVEGTARAWSAGATIGRNFTAKDHNDLIAALQAAQDAVGTAQSTAQEAKDAAGAAEEQAQQAVQTAQEAAQEAAEAVRPALEAAAGAAAAAQKTADTALSTKQDALVGRPGQVVGFDAAGEAAARDGWSNQNLLDGWYFPDPVNQRGQTSYTGIGYMIDRWKSDIGTVSVKVIEGGIKISHTATGVSSLIKQPLDGVVVKAGQSLTFSLFYDTLAITGTDASLSLQLKTGDGLYDSIYTTEESSVLTVVFMAEKDTVVDEAWLIKRGANGTISFRAIAAKLELGTVQTLAHQDADGRWVLNDPPPNKALELLKCQRYYQVFATEALRPSNAQDFRPAMRVNPVLSTIAIDGVTYYTADANL